MIESFCSAGFLSAFTNLLFFGVRLRCRVQIRYYILEERLILQAGARAGKANYSNFRARLLRLIFPAA